MNLVDIIFITASLAYLFFGILLITHLDGDSSHSSWEPTVDIIIAAKNEADNIKACLDSLCSLNYPKNKRNIICIDDDSSDGTAQILKRLQKEKSSHHIKILTLKTAEKEKPGKAGALLPGIESGAGEIIVFTDADCTVPPTWIRSLLDMFTPKVGLVGGYTQVNRYSNSLLSRFQSLDWHFLLSIASAASHLDKPITWVGNNMAIRRSVYDQIGGYRNLDDSLVEDFALIDAVNKQTDRHCRFFLTKASRVRTQPVNTLPDWYRQRKRWALGIRSARLFGQWIMVTGLIAHLFVLLSPLGSLWPFSLLGFLMFVSIDITLITRSARLLGLKFQVIDLLVYEGGYFIYTILLPLFLLFDRKVDWKGHLHHYR